MYYWRKKTHLYINCILFENWILKIPIKFTKYMKMLLFNHQSSLSKLSLLSLRCILESRLLKHESWYLDWNRNDNIFNFILRPRLEWKLLDLEFWLLRLELRLLGLQSGYWDWYWDSKIWRDPYDWDSCGSHCSSLVCNCLYLSLLSLSVCAF